MILDPEKDKGEPVKVYVRIRPEIRSDGDSGQYNHGSIVAPLDEASLKIMPPDGVYGLRKSVSAMDDKIYTFDKVFTQSATQEEIYDHVADHVLETIRGYNTTIFAYGATGSGKSYTMTGNKLAPGIIPRAIGDLFRHIENTAAAESDAFFYVRLSYVELYNNNFRNLLENVSKDVIQRQSLNSLPGGLFSELDDFDLSSMTTTINSQLPTSNSNLKAANGPVAIRGDKIEVRESPSAGVFLAGPNLRIPVTSAQEAFQLIAKGNKHRAVGSTQCNDVSSRSHAILTFHVESKVSISSYAASTDSVAKSELRLGKIHLVDLAGSERLTLSGAEGSTMLETQNINLSLTALGDVLSALSKNAAITQQQQKILSSTASNRSTDALDSQRRMPTLVPVPYRNSKLTHLLKDSLGGNSKTIMITNIRTGKEYFQQTDISLMYASRAKKVRNRSLVNRNVIGDTGIHAVTSEIERLKKSLEERSTEFDQLRLLQMRDAKENSALKNRLQELKEANELEKKQLESQVSTVIHSQAGHIAAQRQKITMLQSALQDELAMSQNRIAEQEKEIKWLKQALDESVQVSLSQPQIQSQVETLQSQAKQSQSELDKVLKHAEELKALNSTLTAKLNESESTRRSLQVDCESVKREKAALQLQLGKEVQLRADRDKQLLKLAEQTKEAEGLLHQKDQLIRQRDVLTVSMETQLKEMTEKNRAIEGTSNHRYRAMKEKVAELEADKLKLTERLESSVRSLEASMADKVRITQKQLQEAAEQILHLQDENKKLDQRHIQKDANIKATADELNKKVLEYQKEAAELSQKLQSSSHDHKLELEEMSMRLRSSEERNSKLNTQEKELKNVVSKLMLAVQQAELKAEQKVQQEKSILISEFEKLMAEKLLQQKKEVDDLKISHANIIADMKAKHGQDMRIQEDRIVEDEAKFQGHLRAAQTKAEQMIDEEIRKGVETLERQHQKALQENRDSMSRERQSDLNALKEDLERNFSKELQQLRLQHELEKEELLRTERDHRLKEQELLKVRFTESKVSIEKDFKLEKDSLASKWNSEIDSLKQKVAENAKKEASLIDRIRMLEKNVQEKKDHLESAKREVLTSVAAVKSEYEEKLKSLYAESSQRQQAIESKAATNLAARDQEWDAIMQAKETELTKARHLLQKKEHEMEQQRLLFEMSGDKQSKEVREATETMRTQLQEQWEESIRNLQTEHRESVVKALESQGKQLKTRYEGDIQILKSKLAQENVKTISDLQSKHTIEMEKSMAEHRHAAAEDMRELRKSLEVAMQRLVAEKDEALAHEQQLHSSSTSALEEQLLRAQQELKQQQQLRQSLTREVDNLHQVNIDLTSQHRLEMQSVLADKQRQEASHQEFIGSLFKEHQEEITKQRKALELSHSKVISNLNDELAQVNERYNFAIAESAIKHSQESSKATLDQQIRFEELKNRLVRQVDEKERALEELKESYRLELISKEEEMERKSVRLVTELKERFSRELDDARHSYEQSLSSQLRQLSASHSKEMEDMASEQRQLLQASDSQLVQLKESLTAVNSQIQSLESQLQRTSDDALSKLSESNERSKSVIEDLKIQHNIQVTQLKATLEIEHQQRFESTKDEWSKELRTREEEIGSLQNQILERNEELSRLEAFSKKQYDDLQLELDVAREYLHTEKQKAVDTKATLSETSTTLNGQLDDLRRLHSEEIELLNNKNVTELRRLTDALDEAHAQELHALEKALTAQMDKKESDFEASQKLLLHEHANVVVDLKSALSNSQKTVDQLKNQCAQLATTMQEQDRNSDSKLDTLASRHLDEIARLNEIHAKEKDDLLNQLRRVHAKELNDLQLSFDEEKVSFHQQLHGLNQQIVERIQEVELHHSEHVQSLNSTLAIERKHALDLQESHKKEILLVEMTVSKDLQTTYDRLLADKDNLLRESMIEKDFEITCLKKLLDSTVGDHSLLAETAAQERDRLLAEVDTERRKYENEKSDIIRQHEESIRTLTSNMTDAHERSLLQLQKEHEEKLAKTSRHKEDELRISREQASSRLHDIENELQRAIDQASADLNQHKGTIAHLESQMCSYQETIHTLEAKFEASERAYQTVVDELELSQKESKREMSRLIDDAAETSSRHTELCDVYVQKIAVLEKRLEQLGLSNSSLQEESIKRVGELEKQLRLLHAQLQSTEESKSNEIGALKRELEKAISERDAELGRLRESFTDELREQEDGLVEQYESTMSSLKENLKQDHWKQMDELRTRYRKDVEQMNFDSTERNDLLQKRLDSLQEKVTEAEVVVKELNRQLTKANAQRETAQQDTLRVQLERDALLDRINALEIELAEALSKAKLTAQQQLLQERNRSESLHKQKVSELQAELAEKAASESAKAVQLTEMEKQLASSQVAMKTMEEDFRVFKSFVAEREAVHDSDLKKTLEDQKDELQSGYLKLIQDQVQSLTKLVQAQNENHSLAQSEELNAKFLGLVKTLPSLWQQKHAADMSAGIFQPPAANSAIVGTDSINISTSSSVESTHEILPTEEKAAGPASSSSSSVRSRVPRTPLHLLANQSTISSKPSEATGRYGRGSDDPDSDVENSPNGHQRGFAGQFGFDRPKNTRSKSALPWSSPSLRSSPTDQLIAAILDGDVQGVRSVIRSNGDDLRAPFWRDIVKSVLPLHRAVSGLHFHGNERLLISTIEALSVLGADINATDHAGNTVLQKAIQVCTSKNVAAIVSTLLAKGANAKSKNKDGDTPLHSECIRVRSASAEVISALVSAGADVNSKNIYNSAVTPLSLVLLRGTAVSIEVWGNERNEMSPADSAVTLESRYLTRSGDKKDSQKASVNRRVWLKTVAALIRHGCTWDPLWRSSTGSSQLHLLVLAFPPHRDDVAVYKQVLQAALEHSSLVEEDCSGRSAVFLLVERMASTPLVACSEQESSLILHMMMRLLRRDDKGGVEGSTGHHKARLSADRSGRTVLDVEEMVSHSCLSAVRPLLIDYCSSSSDHGHANKGQGIGKGVGGLVGEGRGWVLDNSSSSHLPSRINGGVRATASYSASARSSQYRQLMTDY